LWFPNNNGEIKPQRGGQPREINCHKNPRRGISFLGLPPRTSKLALKGFALKLKWTVSPRIHK